MSKKILFIKKGNTRFENNDINILSRSYDVSVFEPTHSNFIYGIWLILKCDLIYFWFPNDYKFLFSLIAKIFQKKIFIVAGGQMSLSDSKKSREFSNVKYRPLYIILGILCLKFADKIVAVSNYEKKGLARYVDKSNIILIYNSIDNYFRLKNKTKRDNKLILSVSALKNTHYFRKGLDIFSSLSTIMPDYSFVLVGKDFNDGASEIIKNNIKSNFKLTGKIPDAELKSWYSKATIYCQFSRQEGFGVALAEAICCGCIPIVTKFGAIPEVVGPNGFYTENDIDIQKIKKVIENIKLCDFDINKSSNRIYKKFNSNLRQKKLLDEVKRTLIV